MEGGDLPKSLKILQCQVLNGPLPPNLTHLGVARSQFKGVLPATITHLSGDSDKLIELPPNLVEFNMEAGSKCAFPESVTTLKLGDYSCALSSLPKSLTHFSLGDHVHPLPSLPKSITHLEITSRESLELPPNLIHLDYTIDTGAPLPILPNSLLHLVVSDVLPSFPPNLTTLKFTHQYTSTIPELPRTLEALEFSYSFNQDINDLLNLPALHTLKFGTRYKKPLTNPPPNLKILHISNSNCISFLPSSLEQLKIFKASFPMPPLPVSLMQLEIYTLKFQTWILPPKLHKLSIANKPIRHTYNCLAVHDLHYPIFGRSLKYVYREEKGYLWHNYKLQEI